VIQQGQVFKFEEEWDECDSGEGHEPLPPRSADRGICDVRSRDALGRHAGFQAVSVPAASGAAS
jgi:hypothetical protein